MSEEAIVAVPDRHADQDVIDWMKRCVATSLGADHAARNPSCKETEMEYAKIPYDNQDAGIGYPAVKH